MRPLPALAITALIVAVVIAAGIGVDWLASPHPTAAFAKCQTAQTLAPRLYAGPPAMCIDPEATYTGTIKTTKGDFSMVFLTSSTPKTVNNFIVLAENGYFDGSAFFRTEDWVVQTGDPLNNGRGGPGYSLPEEPPGKNDQWVPGSLGMARFPDGTISGSQFFILRQSWPGGDPTLVYNHFATVTLGFDVVSQLTSSDRILSVSIRRA
jgi:cyclophilin family peptidyl-prolyl cis-trans isomerase